MWLVLSASQETRYSCSSFTGKNSWQKTPSTESPTSTKHTRTILNPKCCFFVAFGPQLVSTFVELLFVTHTLRFTEELQRLLAMSVSHKMQCRTLVEFAEKRSILRRPGSASSVVYTHVSSASNCRGIVFAWCIPISFLLYTWCFHGNKTE